MIEHEIMIHSPNASWSLDASQVLADLKSDPQGLSTAEAASRLAAQTPRRRSGRGHDAFWLLVGQFKSPITIILMFAALLSFFLHDRLKSIDDWPGRKFS